jgi:hypothetical protein
MKRRPDELSFEGAWEKQYVEEKKDTDSKSEKKEVEVYKEPSFRGQRNIVENRNQLKMPNRKKVEKKEKKEVTIVEAPSSKEGDEFDVEW